jgi:hypothetical protein
MPGGANAPNDVGAAFGAREVRAVAAPRGEGGELVVSYIAAIKHGLSLYSLRLG